MLDIKPEATNQEIVDQFNEDFDDEKLKEAIQEEIARRGIDWLTLSDEPTPARTSPGEPNPPGVEYFSNNQTMIEVFRSSVYGLGYDEAMAAAANDQESQLAKKRARRVEALDLRIGEIEKEIAKSKIDLVKTELKARVNQLKTERRAVMDSTIKVKKSLAGFIVDTAEFIKSEKGVSEVEIRQPHVCAKRAQHVIIHWGFDVTCPALMEG